MFDPLQSVLPHVRGAKLRALGTRASKERSPVLARVPTLAEAGLSGFAAEAWWAVFGPAHLPVTVSNLLRLEIERIVRSDTFRDSLGNLAVTPVATMPMAGRVWQSTVPSWSIFWGYGYVPMPASMAQCVEAAVTGKLS